MMTIAGDRELRMISRKRYEFAVALLLVTGFLTCRVESAESRAVSVVVGAKADKLERYAAEELCSYLDKL